MNRLRTVIVLALTVVVSSCMMPGMMGMGGMGGMGGGAMGGAEHTAPPPTVIKETTGQGIRVSAIFPSFAVGDRVVYTVTVTRVTDAAPVTDAVLSMNVVSDAGATTTSELPHAHEWTPAPGGPGSYVFHPSIPPAGAQRVIVVVRRADDRLLAPPLELEHIVQLHPGTDPMTTHGARKRGWGVSTLLIAGAAAMAVMMLVSLR